MKNSLFLRILSLFSTVFCKFFEAIVSFILTIALAPILLIIWLLNEIIRFIISIILSIKSRNADNPQIKLVSEGADGIWAFLKSGNTRNIIILYIYNSKLNLKTFQKNYLEKVIHHVDPTGVRPYEKLTKIFTIKYGYCCWKESKNFSIENHVKSIHSEGEDKIVTESQVLKHLSSLSEDMNEAQPQWEEIIVPHFIYDEDIGKNKEEIQERSARIYRSHHAYMDGCSKLLMTGTCMNDLNNSPFPYMVDPLAPLKVPIWKQVIFKLHSALLGLSTLVRGLLYASQIKSRFLMKNYSGKQNFSWSSPLDLGTLREIREKTKASIPSILASASLGALKKLDELYPKGDANYDNVMKNVPIGLVGAILPYPDSHPKNRFTVINFTPSGMRETDRIKRLVRTGGEMRKLVSKADGLVNYNCFKIFGKFPLFVLQMIMSGAGTPVIYSNVPWAGQKVKLWGHEVQDVAGWMPLLTTAGLGLLTVSYFDKMRFCVITDENCLSEKEVSFLISEVQQEIQLLALECSTLPNKSNNISITSNKIVQTV